MSEKEDDQNVYICLFGKKGFTGKGAHIFSHILFFFQEIPFLNRTRGGRGSEIPIFAERPLRMAPKTFQKLTFKGVQDRGLWGPQYIEKIKIFGQSFTFFI